MGHNSIRQFENVQVVLIYTLFLFFVNYYFRFISFLIDIRY